MQHREETFRNERVSLDGKSFHGCTFENCELEFTGDRPPTFSDNRYVNTVFVLSGPAVRTVYLLSNICHAGEGGRQVFEALFEDIRNHDVHGHEITTKIPDTPDHSMA